MLKFSSHRLSFVPFSYKMFNAMLSMQCRTAYLLVKRTNVAQYLCCML